MMKRKGTEKALRVVFVCVLILISAFIFGQDTSVQAAAQQLRIIYGDVNYDGKINNTDSIIVNRHIAAEKSKEIYQKHPDWILKGKFYTAADIDKNNKIDITDLLMIQRHIAWYKGSRVSKIVTVTLMSDERCYDCFPIIYDVNRGAYYPYLPSIYKTGYTFQGWYTKKTGGERGFSYSPIKKAENHTLYSKWSINSYKVSFDTNGGSSINTTKSVPYGKYYGTLPTPVRTGYKFGGWYTQKNGGTKVSSTTRMEAQNVLLYAHWNPIVPGKPSLSEIKANSYNKITITWRAASNATHYGIFYKTSGESWKQIATLGSTDRSYTHISSKRFPIKLGKKYVYTVRAYNSFSKKWGNYDKIGISSRTSPTAVKLKSARLDAKKSTVTISWNKAYGGDTYYVYRKTSSNAAWKRIATLRSNVLSYTDKKPVKGTTNIYTVRMYSSKEKIAGGYDKKGVSATVSIYPGKVQLAQISSNNNNVKIVWKKVSNATHYKIYYKVPGGKWKGIAQVGPATTSFTHKGLTAGKKYYYVVRAYNSRFNTYGAYDSGGWGITVRGSNNGVSFRSLLGKVYEYKNTKFKYGIAFGKNHKAYLGVWNRSGTSSSYEDFFFEIKEGKSSYRLKGARSGYYYRVNLIPGKNYVKVKISCEVSSYNHFNINTTFNYTKNDYLLQYTGSQIENSSGNATKAFENFMKKNYKGYYYAIVNAGYNKETILIVTTAFRGNSHYKPSDNVGYPIYVYRYKNGIVQLAVKDQLTQSISAGPWYYYKNKLYTLARRGGYYRLDIFASGYERKFVNSYSSTIFADKNIVKLKKCN